MESMLATFQFGKYSNVVSGWSHHAGKMTGLKNGFGDPREIPPRRGTSSSRRRRGLYAAAGGLAAVAIAVVAIASNLGGKGARGCPSARSSPTPGRSWAAAAAGGYGLLWSGLGQWRR